MKQSFFDKHFDKIFTLFIGSALFFVFVGVPVSVWYSSGVRQKALNAECGTDYSRIDVMLSGESLTELCRIKQQEILLKQK